VSAAGPSLAARQFGVIPGLNDFRPASKAFAKFIAIDNCASSVRGARSSQNDECCGLEGIIAGRSPLRLATLSLPTHREVVAAAFRISALVPPN
jgi:hypothetical protein